MISAAQNDKADMDELSKEFDKYNEYIAKKAK